jgi:hypothetical protein
MKVAVEHLASRFDAEKAVADVHGRWPLLGDDIQARL